MYYISTRNILSHTSCADSTCIALSYVIGSCVCAVQPSRPRYRRRCLDVTRASTASPTCNLRRIELISYGHMYNMACMSLHVGSTQKHKCIPCLQLLSSSFSHPEVCQVLLVTEGDAIRRLPHNTHVTRRTHATHVHIYVYTHMHTHTCVHTHMYTRVHALSTPPPPSPWRHHLYLVCGLSKLLITDPRIEISRLWGVNPAARACTHIHTH